MYLRELFDPKNARKIVWTLERQHQFTGEVVLSNGTDMAIHFGLYKNPDIWSMSFDIAGSFDRTNAGIAKEIFATMAEAVRYVIDKRNPGWFVFHADENDPVRVRTYKKISKRFEPSYIDVADQPDLHPMRFYPTDSVLVRADIYKALMKNKDDLAKSKEIFETLEIEERRLIKLRELYDPGTAFKLTWDEELAALGEVHAEAKDGRGRLIAISFIPTELGKDGIEVVFRRGDSYDITGGGEVGKVIATVLNAINIYLKKYEPEYVVFSSKGASRTSAYMAIIKRILTRFKYELVTRKELPPDLEPWTEFLGSSTPFIFRKIKAAPDQ